MAIISGQLVNIVLGPATEFSTGRPVWIRDGETVIATGILDDGNEFSIDVGDATGQLEISVGLPEVAPVLIDFDGTDAHIDVFHNGGRRYA